MRSISCKSKILEKNPMEEMSTYYRRNFIESWLTAMDLTRYEIQHDKVNVMGDVNLSGRGLSKLPVKFGTVYGNFDCSWNQLQSLEDFPKFVRGDINCQYNRIANLLGIEENFSHVSGTIFLNENPIATGGLGAIQIPGLSGIEADSCAFKIIGKYLQQPENIFHCQSELFDCGFEPFAEL
jgi:hypothetical protein